MLKINAIPTIYNNIKFRSRLEARYAVFFDNTNVEYLYEPEGYILPNGKCYLPDFYLPQLDLFIEIKPTKPTQEEIDNAVELVNMTETGLIFFQGAPSSKTIGKMITGNLSCLSKNKKLIDLSVIANSLFSNIARAYTTKCYSQARAAFNRFIKDGVFKEITTNEGFKDDFPSICGLMMYAAMETDIYGFFVEPDRIDEFYIQYFEKVIEKAFKKSNDYKFSKFKNN